MKAQLLAVVVFFFGFSGLAAATDDPFVVHEWGTFTTVHAASGDQIWWMPPASDDVPDFVYRSGSSDTWQKPITHPKDLLSLARMETPVIYLYSRRERIVDVRVLFNGGFLTEWYPQATNAESLLSTTAGTAADAWRFRIEWNGVKVLARDTKEMTLPRLIRGESGGGDHYYIARETDANFLRTASPSARKGPEYERDLFYRGLGYFQAPLAVGMDADEQQVSLSAREAGRIDGMFVLTVRQGMMRYQKVDRAASAAAIDIEVNAQPFGALGDVRKVAMNDMARALVAAGLYEKEARAMVNTWQDQWFAEEGTRVLYLLPRAWTDRTLQLQVSPKPDSVERVMVGRAELITPRSEREIKKQILTFKSGDPKAKARAVADVRALGLGRFLYPAISRATAGETNEAVAKAAWELLAAVNAREDARSARN